MYKLISQNRRAFLMLIDTSAIALSFFGAFLLRFDFNIPSEFLSLLISWLPVFIGIQLIFFNISGFYNVIWRFTSVWEMLNIIKSVTISSLTGIVFLGLIQGWAGYPRSVILIFYILNVLTICSSRIAVRLYFSHFHHSSAGRNIHKKRIILIGAGKTGEKIIREIIGTPSSPFTVMGFVDDDISIQGASLHGFKVLGTVKDLPNLTIKYDEILITSPSATGDQMRKIVKVSKSTGKPFKTVPSLIELIDKDISLANIRNVSYSDLLGRKEVKLDMNSIKEMLNGKRVLITGAGGSIGSELVTQCLTFSPSEIICYDNNEEKIFDISVRANKHETPTIIKPVLGSVLNKNELAKVFNETKPQIILHAAAYKHVPIQEDHPWNAVNTNVQGTLNMVEMADKNNAEKFVLVSTDKAVNPVNVMGATKRIAEKIIQSINLSSKTQFMAVRFGNVLGSSGSAIPTFQKQINEGGPVTITHPEMTRFFMSIQEASQLILQSAAIGRDGEIFLLEMGKSIKIDQMARDLIRLSGLEPEEDIPIVYTGLRPGEKLYEELQTQDENLIVTDHKKIMILKGENHKVSWEEFKVMVQECINIAQTLDIDKIQLSLKNLVPYYQPRPFSSKVPSKQQDSFPIRWEA